MKSVAEAHGAAVANLNRTVMNGDATLAVTRDALQVNPIRDLGAIRKTGPARPATSLTAAGARQLRAWLTYNDAAVRRDLTDLVGVMLATSIRIAEAVAPRWEHIDLEAGIVQVVGNVIRVKGAGLQINTYESNKLTFRILRLPGWAITLLRIRHDRKPSTATLVFPGLRDPSADKLRDPSNTSADLRDAFTTIGYNTDTDKITSHVFRKPSPLSWTTTAAPPATEPTNSATPRSP